MENLEQCRSWISDTQESYIYDIRHPVDGGGRGEAKKWYKFRRKWMVTAGVGEGEGIHRNWMSTAIISISVIRVQTVFQTGVWFCYKCSRLVSGSAISVPDRQVSGSGGN